MVTISGLLLVISGPSGVGKSTIIEHMLVSGLAECECVFSVSMTTRLPRQGEIEGINYHFVSRDRFLFAIEHNELLEYAEFAGQFYGTPEEPIREAMAKGQCVILDIESHGMLQVRERAPDAVTVFVTPPDWDELRKRLRGRGTENEELIEARLEISRVDYDNKVLYDHIIVNTEIDEAAAQLAEIINKRRRLNYA
ncbi:MAG: guanylate kinase [Oscillospiraceae bacterium]|nr:guanylate kinase [Oscillospiraceae bacterium]